MFRFLSLLSLLLSAPLFALETQSTQINELDWGHGDEDGLVFLNTGKVAKVLAHEEELKNQLQEALIKKQWLNITMNKEREILAVESIEAPQKDLETFEGPENKSFEYNPTILANLGTAFTHFKEMRRGALSDSQCYNRAHVWAYEWKMKHDINSMKVWIFFTRKYIRRYNFEWWFHVAPYVYVDESTGVKERVMDFKFTYSPLYLRDWTNHFMQNDPKCPSIRSYSQYEKENSEEWCYVMKTNMYYYQPLDIYNLEETGPDAKKSFFMDWEVRNAHSQAFGIRPQY